MLAKLKEAYRRTKNDQVGQRFANLNRWWRSQRSGPAGKVILVAVGVVLIVGGFLLGLIPGVPGIVLGVVGAGILAAQFPKAARWLDRIEVRVRKWIAWFRSRFAPHHD